MNTALLAMGIGLLVFVVILIVWLINTSFAGRKDIAAQAASLGLLQRQLETLKAGQDRTSEALQRSLQVGQTNLQAGLTSSQETLGRLNSQIGELQGANRQMLQLGTEVRRLQDVLSSPKLRGQMGEWSLENLLAQVLPADTYQLQYAFRDGKVVDALVRMSDYAVSIDAKFPLPGFERMLHAATEADRVRLRRQFLKDVALHIDKIASAYIRPAEGTLDFALMYIPAENVYYETIIRHDSDGLDLAEYGLGRRVVPVSPNLLYVYLMTVGMGLHGLRIERQAAEIQQNLKRLRADVGELAASFETLGSHLRNAGAKYEDSRKQLDRLGLQLDQNQTTKSPSIGIDTAGSGS